MKLKLKKYQEQKELWPASGKHIMAQYDSESIVVYQAYNQPIGDFASRNQYFGGNFSLNRMSWIKPNFLWMMFRCGWASRENQTVVLAVRLKREGFETILENAVHSSMQHHLYDSQEAWKEALARFEVRLQWDPDHDPHGAKEERRAIQLGMKGSILKKYSREWIIEIEDISEYVRDSSGYLKSSMEKLETPEESVYPVSPAIARRLGMS